MVMSQAKQVYPINQYHALSAKLGVIMCHLLGVWQLLEEICQLFDSLPMLKSQQENRK